MYLDAKNGEAILAALRALCNGRDQIGSNADLVEYDKIINTMAGAYTSYHYDLDRAAEKLAKDREANQGLARTNEAKDEIPF